MSFSVNDGIVEKWGIRSDFEEEILELKKVDSNEDNLLVGG
ncbi:hypothetical protein AB3U99_22585 [Niallia sp. JL1B1071]